MDSLLLFDNEGQGSPVGSVGCCSLLESDDDLQFLSDLGPKFRTLAEICSPPKPSQPPRVESVVESKQTIQKESNIAKSTVNINQSSTSMVNVHQSSTSSVNISQSAATRHVTRAPLSPPAGQTILVQQPMYYTTTPIVQPMHYVVQPQVHNTVLLAERPAANLQGMIVIDGSQVSSQGLVIQGNRVISETSTSDVSTTSPGSLTRPTITTSPVMMAPGSPGLVQGSVPTGGWSTVGRTSDGKYMIVERQVRTEAQGLSPGVPQGTLPRGAVLVQEAVPPQGVLGTAAQGGVRGILPGHTLTRGVGQEGMGSVRVVPVGVGQPRVGQVMLGQSGMGQVMLRQAGMGQVMLVQPGIGQVMLGQPGMGQVRGTQFGEGQVLAGQTAVRQVLPAGVVQAGFSQVSVGQMTTGFQGVPVCAQRGPLLRGCMTSHEGSQVIAPRHTSPPEVLTTQTNTVAESRFTFETAGSTNNEWGNPSLSEEEEEPGETSEDVSESEDTEDEFSESETPAVPVPEDPTREDGTKEEDALEASPLTTEITLDEGPGEERLVLATETSERQSEQPDLLGEERAEEAANIGFADESISPIEVSEDLHEQTAEETALEIRSPVEESVEEVESQGTEAQEDDDLSDEGSGEDASMLAQGSTHECSLSGSDIIDLVAEDQSDEEESRMLAQEEEVMSGLSQDEPTVDNVDENLEEESPEEMGSEVHLDHLTMGVPVIPTVTSDLEEVLSEFEEVGSDADSDHLTVENSRRKQEETLSEKELSQLDLHEKPSAENITDGGVEEENLEQGTISHQNESGNSIGDDQEVEQCIEEEVTSSLQHQTSEDSFGDDHEEEEYIEEEYTKEEVMSSLQHQTSEDSFGDDHEEEEYIEEEYTKEEVMSSLQHQTSEDSIGDDQEEEKYTEEEYTKEELMSSLQHQTPGEYIEGQPDQDSEISPSVESEGVLEEEDQTKIIQDVEISEETETVILLPTDMALSSQSFEEASEGGESQNGLVVGEVSNAEVTSTVEVETELTSSMPETEIVAVAEPEGVCTDGQAVDVDSSLVEGVGPSSEAEKVELESTGLANISATPSTEGTLVLAAEPLQIGELSPAKDEFGDAEGVEVPEGAVSTTEVATEPTDAQGGVETAGATGGETGEVTAQEVTAPTPWNKLRKSKKGSTKSPKSPTSPSRRCSQQ